MALAPPYLTATHQGISGARPLLGSLLVSDESAGRNLTGLGMWLKQGDSKGSMNQTGAFSYLTSQAEEACIINVVPEIF